jgi:hypothetical protein
MDESPIWSNNLETWEVINTNRLISCDYVNIVEVVKVMSSLPGDNGESSVVLLL